MDRRNPVDRAIIACEACPELREYCRTVAREKRAAYRDEDYWGRPVPNLGPVNARLLLVGLAPAAHGANRTGRMFSGDRSGDFLFQALYNCGFATQPSSRHTDDGLRLVDCRIGSVIHCAPPGNKPTAAQRRRCQPYLVRTLQQMRSLRVILALGRVAFEQCVRISRQINWHSGKAPRFTHGKVFELAGSRRLIACYHPSQYNTFTGRLTQPMLVEVLERAKVELG